MEELKKQGGSAEAEESFIDPQLMPTEGMGERKATQRRKDRVMQILHTLPEKAQTAILESLTEEDMQRYGISKDQDRTELIEITRENPPEDADPFGYQAMQENPSESMVEGSPAGEGEGEGSQAGSGDPNADAEARRAPPDPPESDEPLVGVPVDEYAGGTVVLPQGGEHTKSDEEKADAAGSDDESDDQDQQSGRTGPSSRRPNAHQQRDQEQGPSRDQGVRLEEQGPPSSPGTRRRTMPTSTPRRSRCPPSATRTGSRTAPTTGSRHHSKREGGLRRLFHRS